MGEGADIGVEGVPGGKLMLGGNCALEALSSLQNSRIPLDQLTVRHLTRILSARKRKHPPAQENRLVV